MSAEPQLPRVGDLIDRGKYRIDALIGEGGMGAVFAATHMQMGGKRRAIKWLLPKLARDENAVRRFLAEANIAARIDHPNVVSPIDVSVDVDAPYIVMELLQGETLADYLGEQSVSLQRAGVIFLPILQGVAAAHDQNIVHRDLKPGNIFLARWGSAGRIPKVLDFGIAKVLDNQHSVSALTDQGALLGTLHYMSPEQLQNARDVGPQADVYALGVILYRMLSGRLPYEGNLLDLALRIREGRPVPLAAYVELPEGLDEVVMRALSPSLQHRYPDVRSFAQALSPYFPEHGVDFSAELRPARPHPISELPPEPGRTRARNVDTSRSGLRDSSDPPAENSTFHPIATRSSSSRGSRAWIWAGAIGLALAAGVAAFAWSERHERADGGKEDGERVRPDAPSADSRAAAAGQPPASPDPMRGDTRAEPEAAPAAGWTDLGGVVQPRPQQPPQPQPSAPDRARTAPRAAQPAPAPTPTARQRELDVDTRSRPPRARAGAAAARARSSKKQQDAGAGHADTPARSPLDTILEQNSERLDTILDTGSPQR